MSDTPPSHHVNAEELKIGSRVMSGFSLTPRVITELKTTDTGMIMIQGFGWKMLRHPTEPVRVLREEESTR